MHLLPSLLTLSLPLLSLAQDNTSTANGCDTGYYPGTDTVIFTTPYTYAQVMSIIGSFRNITWSGSPYDSVTLNGTDNTVGTARTYNIDGAHVVETITLYSKPPNGPYDEVHVLSPITIPSANVSLYGDYDGTTVVETCNGLASTFNFTIDYCATNATVAAAVLHTIHLTDAQTVGVFLGGMNFTSCEALYKMNATATATATMSASVSATSPAAFTGAAERVGIAGLGGVLAAVAAFVI